MNNVVLSPDIYELVGSFFDNEENEKVIAQLTQASRDKGAETYSARVLNHWEKEGVIGDLRDGGRGWRKYSQLDRILIQLVQQLRAFGYPLVNIKQLKEAIDKESLLEFAIGYSKLHKKSLRLLVTAGTNPQFALLSDQGWPNDTVPPTAFLELDVEGLLNDVSHLKIQPKKQKSKEHVQEEPKYRSKMFQYFNKKD